MSPDITHLILTAWYTGYLSTIIRDDFGWRVPDFEAEGLGSEGAGLATINAHRIKMRRRCVENSNIFKL